MQAVLVTGAAGGIGSHLLALLKGVYPSIRWSDRVLPAVADHEREDHASGDPEDQQTAREPAADAARNGGAVPAQLG